MGKEKVCCIYGIKNKTDNKIYIGQTINLENRIKDHMKRLSNEKHWNNYLQRAWDKHGEENFEFIVLEECEENKDILNEKEIYWIKKLNSTNKEFGYNGEHGGSANKKVSEETREKMSKARMGKLLSDGTKRKIREKLRNRIVSEETKEKHRILSSGENNPMYGKHLSEETKKKLSEINKGRESPNKGNKFSDEVKGRLKITNSGENNGRFDKKIKNKSSEFIGVCFHKQSGTWRSSIVVNKKTIHLGNHKTEIDAAKARDKYITDNNLPNKLSFPNGENNNE
jgi:group I intron endonuclease